MALSKQEQQELAELEALEAQEAAIPSSGSKVIDAVQAVPEAASSIGSDIMQGAKDAASGLSTFARSAAETATFGAVRPASAWLNAKIEKNLYGGNEAELYQKNLDSYDKVRLEDNINNPNYDMAGNIAGLVGTGTVVAKGAAKAGLKLAGPTLAQAGSKLGYIKAAAGPLLTNAAIDGFVAGTQVEGKKSFGVLKEDKSSLDTGVENFFFSAGAQGLIKSGVMIGSALSSAGKADFVKATMSNLGGSAKKATQQYISYFKKKGVPDEVIVKEANDTIEAIGLNKADVASDPILVKQNLDNLMSQKGKAIEEGYEYIDRATNNAPVDMTDSLDSIKRILAPKAGGATAVQNANQQALTEISEDFFNADGTAKKRSLKGLWNLLADANDADKGVWPSLKGKDRDQTLGAIRDTLSKYRKDFFRATEEASNKSKTALTGIQDDLAFNQKDYLTLTNNLNAAMKQADGIQDPVAKKAFIRDNVDSIKSDIKEVDKIIKDLEGKSKALEQTIKQTDPIEILAGNFKPGGSAGNSENIPEFIKRRNSLVNDSREYERLIQFNKVIQKSSIPETTEGLLGGFVKDALSRPFQTIAAGAIFGAKAATGVAAGRASMGVLSKAMQKISNETTDATILRFTERANKTFNNLQQSGNDTFLSRVSTAVLNDIKNDDLTEEQLYVKLESNIAKTNLYLAPIPRNTKGAKERMEDLFALATESNPEIADVMANAIDMEDDNALGGALDALSKQPELAKFFESGQGWDNKLYDPKEKEAVATSIKMNLSIPGLAKAKLVEQVISTGELPDLSQYERQPKTYAPRDKGKVR